MTVDVLDVLRTKREGRPLTGDMIDHFVTGYLAGSISEEQAAALLMAIVWRGMEPAELARWTGAMVASGTRSDWSSLDRPVVDKHSTGGVGDKVSLVLVPLLMACGVAVPQFAGRGLGHTGGTLDKLESIDGFRTDLDADEVHRAMSSIGGVIAAANETVAPVDRRLYALRDVTGTVESVPLIASSIMSKKIAEGTPNLVLDVKVGAGAFLPDRATTEDLARTMVQLGTANGVRTVALLTAMDQPLGRAVGNAIEVAEAIDVLTGGGPDDVRALTLGLADEALRLADVEADPARALDDGRAMECFERLVANQGGDLSASRPIGPGRHEVVAGHEGYVAAVDCRAIGVAVARLGAGRLQRDDAVSHGAGATVDVRIGDHVERGQPLLVLHLDDDRRLPAALDALTGAFVIGDELPVAPLPLVIERIAGTDADVVGPDDR